MKITYRYGVMTSLGEYPPENEELAFDRLEAAQERAEAEYREYLGPEFIIRWEAVDPAHQELFESGHGGTGYYVRQVTEPDPVREPGVFQAGDRVRLVKTDDPITRLRPGDEGTVQAQYGKIVHVRWDSGSDLAILLDAGDRIELADSGGPYLTGTSE